MAVDAAPEWIERPPGVRKVVGSNPVMGSEFFFLSIIDLKRRHCVAVVIYLFISKPLPKNYHYLQKLPKHVTILKNIYL